MFNVAIMKISIDTKEDSHDEIKKVIKMLQNLVGNSQEIFINQPISESSDTEATGSQFDNIFGDTSSSTQETKTTETTQEAQSEETTESAESTESTEDLFAELFSEEELKKMDEADIKNKEEGEDLEVKPKGKKYSIEFY